ncbi:MAG: hypothetical protein ABI630_09175 [Betaproteobacteria bacterium]
MSKTFPDFAHRRSAVYGVTLAAALVLGGWWASNQAAPATVRFRVAVMHGLPPVLPGTAISASGWGSHLDKGTVEGWKAVQRKYGFPDAAMEEVISALKQSGRFERGNAPNDLTAFPASVDRALALLASSAGDAKGLRKELNERILRSAPFPDEAPGPSARTSVTRAVDNYIVLSVVEVLLNCAYGDVAQSAMPLRERPATTRI